MITPQPAETSQTEYSRWGSPAQTRQTIAITINMTETTFAGRAVTHQGLDAQRAPTQLTSDVLEPINAFTPV